MEIISKIQHKIHDVIFNTFDKGKEIIVGSVNDQKDTIINKTTEKIHDSLFEHIQPLLNTGVEISLVICGIGFFLIMFGKPKLGMKCILSGSASFIGLNIFIQ